MMTIIIALSITIALLLIALLVGALRVSSICNKEFYNKYPKFSEESITNDKE